MLMWHSQLGEGALLEAKEAVACRRRTLGVDRGEGMGIGREHARV